MSFPPYQTDPAKTLLIDCDGVLLNWTAGFRTFLRLEKNIETNGEVPDHWNMESWTGVPWEATEGWIREFNDKSWEFGTLPPHPDAQEVLPKFKREGWHCIIITSCSEEDAAIRLRKANLFNHFGPIFDEIHCLSLGVLKLDYLRKYAPSFWIEDNFKNAVAGVDAGHRSFVLRRNHNRNIEKSDTAGGHSSAGVIWASSWNDIYFRVAQEVREVA